MSLLSKFCLLSLCLGAYEDSVFWAGEDLSNTVFSTGRVEGTLRSFVANPEAQRICVLSPYTFDVTELVGQDINASLEAAGSIPLDEGEFGLLFLSQESTFLEFLKLKRKHYEFVSEGDIACYSIDESTMTAYAESTKVFVEFERVIK